MGCATRWIRRSIAPAHNPDFRGQHSPSGTIEFRDPTRIAGAAVSPRGSRSSAAPAANGRALAARPRRGTARAEFKALLGFYRQMLLIRRFEEKTAEMYQRARIGGYCHLNLGEEATGRRLCPGMPTNDYPFTNYR